MTIGATSPLDTRELRKLRGAFFTPRPIVDFIASWAIRDVADEVFEPSAGDAEFLLGAVERLKSLSNDPDFRPSVHGVEIHELSAQSGRTRVEVAGGRANIEVNDFFSVDSARRYTAAIGNPPYVRYQDWSGDSRTRSREAALRAGVLLTGLASSWASFVIQSSTILREGGRLGLVLPAELLSVNYAAPVRSFLFRHFRSLEIVLFEEQVFPEAEADVVILLAEGYGLGPADHAIIHLAKNAAHLAELGNGSRWSPPDPSAKWTGAGVISTSARLPLAEVLDSGAFVALESWGDTTLGMVTGNNRYFALSPARTKELGLRRHEILKLSPPGSTHLRELELSSAMLRRLGRQGKQTHLFHPKGRLSEEAQAYVMAGQVAGIDQAYKCRVRQTWYQVPVIAPADLLLTCMNADTPRLATNTAGAHHLNSVHGVYLKPEYAAVGRELLPLASLNSISLLSAEVVGRAYGGGILKLEPREADLWAMPSPALVESRAEALRGVRLDVVRRLRRGDLLGAVELVDDALLLHDDLISPADLREVRVAQAELSRRRTVRSRRGRADDER